MYIKIINPATNGKNAYSNRGSARQATNYLEGEARKQDQTAVFFTSARADLSGDEAVQLIDSNRKGLRRDDAKFYSLVISPSHHELAHINHDSQKLRTYTARVMQEYAANFTLKAGSSLGEKNLVWVATQHNERHHRGFDGAPSGQKKEGPQTHIHVMVSARDREQQHRLSPLGSVARFNRVLFMAKGIKAFEEEFGLPERSFRRQQRAADTIRATTGIATSVQRRQSYTVEEIAASIRLRAAASATRNNAVSIPGQSTGNFGFSLQLREKQLLNQLTRTNQQRPATHQLNVGEVQAVAASLAYSREVGWRLRLLGREGATHQFHPLPYEFLRTGQDATTATKTLAATQRREQRLVARVEKLNALLAAPGRLVPDQVVQIAREQQHSQAFYGRLTRLDRYARNMKLLDDPHDFLRTGRVKSPLENMPPPTLPINRLPTAPSLSRPYFPVPYDRSQTIARIIDTYQPAKSQLTTAPGETHAMDARAPRHQEYNRDEQERD